MKRLITLLILSSTSLVYSADLDIDALLADQAAASSSDQNAGNAEAEVEKMQNILIASGVDRTKLQVEGDTLAHRAVRMGKVALGRVLGMFGVDYTKKNTQGMTPLELARSMGNAEAAQLLAVDLLAEFEEGAFDEFETKLIDYIQECLVPEGDVEEAFGKLQALVNDNKGTITSLDSYYPKFLQGESLAHALNQYNPDLYIYRDRILDVLEPNHPKNSYKGNRSNDDEVARLLGEYLNNDRNTTFAELKMVFTAWPIAVDCFQTLDGHRSLGVAVDESHDEQLIALCSSKRIDTSRWATAATDPHGSRFIELTLRCLIDQDQGIQNQLDYYLRFSQKGESLCAQYQLPLKVDESNVTITQFLKKLSSELFPRRDELEKRLSIVYFIERQEVSQQACLEQLAKDSVAYPLLKPVLEYALTRYTGPALNLEGTNDAPVKPVISTPKIKRAQTKKETSTRKQSSDKGKSREKVRQHSQISFLSTTTGKLLLTAVVGGALYWLTSPSKKSHKTAASQIW